MVRTDPTTIREELDADTEDLSDAVAETLATRANALVESRLGDEIADVDESLLTDLETLVAAHFAVARTTGAAAGEQVTQVTQESASVTFASADSDEGAGESYWEQATMLDPTGRLAHRQVAPVVVGAGDPDGG